MFAELRIAMGGTNSPDRSGSITSACAPTGVVTTVSPCASPSSTDIASPWACDGSIRISAAAHQGSGRRLIDPAGGRPPGQRGQGRRRGPGIRPLAPAGDRRTPRQRERGAQGPLPLRP
jgi:hypothetical protein